MGLNWQNERYRPVSARRKSGGTRLDVPRTPVQRIMLGAKLYRLKLEAQQRREAAAR